MVCKFAQFLNEVKFFFKPERFIDGPLKWIRQ